MTKTDLIEEVRQALRIPRKEAGIVVVTILDSIVRSLRRGDEVEIRRFGCFGTRQRRSRVGRNPKTGEPVKVSARTIPYFKPSKELKQLINSADSTPVAPAI